jgi:hypothetical protein
MTEIIKIPYKNHTKNQQQQKYKESMKQKVGSLTR